MEAMLRHTEEREMIWDNPHGFTKGKSCLTNLMVPLHQWTREEPLMSSIWSSARLLTWSPKTFFSPNWKDKDLRSGLLSEDWKDKDLRSGSVMSDVPQGLCWGQYSLVISSSMTLMTGLSAPSASLLVTPSSEVQSTHQREGMPSRGT